jgi:hypothetical protein
MSMNKTGRNPGQWGLLLVLCACASSTQPSGNGTTAADLRAPSNFVAAPLGGGVHLTWNDNSDDEELFEIERHEAGTAFALLDTVPFNGDVYHDSAVTLGIAYTYRVRAKFANGYSSYSNEGTTTPSTQNSAGASNGGSATGSSAGTSSGGASQGGTAEGGAAQGGNNEGGAAQGGSSGSTSLTAGSGGAAQAGSGVGGEGGSAPVSFQNDIVPALVQSCGSTTVGCHNADQAVGRIMPQFGPCKVIWFSAVDEPVGATYISGPNQGQPTGCTDLTLYERLMDLHSMLCDAPSWEQRAKYVVPGDLDNSLLYQVIAGDPSMSGQCLNMGAPVGTMPKVDPAVLPNGVPLSEDKIAKIRDWILQGAPNN